MFTNSSLSKQQNVPLGIFHSLVACLYWSIVFVVPSILGTFKDVDIVLARYTVFGLFSLLTILCKRKNIFKQVTWKNWKVSLVWAALINVVYYLGIALGIRHCGAAVSIIVAGLSPIAILIYSNFKKRDLSFPTLIAISIVIFLGVILTNISEFHSSSTTSPFLYLFGLCSVITSSTLWVFYIILNQKFLEENSHITPEIWGHMLGISSLVICLPLIFLLDGLGITHLYHDLFFHTPFSERWLFILLCSVMGVFSSSLAITSWNKASLHLSSALLGALLIFEPIFGLVISYICERAYPSLQEGVGASLMLGGSLLALVLFHKKSSKKVSSKIIPPLD